MHRNKNSKIKHRIYFRNKFNRKSNKKSLIV